MKSIKSRFLLPVVRDLVMECYGHISKIQQNGLNFSWACEGVDRFTVGASDTLEKISIDFPSPWSADADLCQEKSGASNFWPQTLPLWKHNSARFKMQDR